MIYALGSNLGVADPEAVLELIDACEKAGVDIISMTRAVDDVSFYIERGETLGLVGQSGCGKSTLGQCVLRLIEPTAGKIVFNGTDITALDNRALNSIRPSMQMIFQDPDSSLDPKMTIGQSIAEPLKLKGNNREKTESKVVELIKQVGLSPEHIHRFPHQLSGGQNQRAVIARVLALEPVFIVADEPTASLDISVQAQILNLLKDLKEEYDLTMALIIVDWAGYARLARSSVMAIKEQDYIKAAKGLGTGDIHGKYITFSQKYTIPRNNAFSGFIQHRS